MSALLSARCGCGTVRLQFRNPLLRVRCHCTICQRVNAAPSGDPVLVWRHQVEQVDGADALVWSRTRWLPVHVNRGSCGSCGELIYEHVAFTPFSFVIGKTFEQPAALPPVAGHLFYDRRVADVDDDLPKPEGYLASQLGFVRWAIHALLRHPR